MEEEQQKNAYPIFCISLLENNNRWQRMTTRIQKSGISPYRFIASTPETINQYKFSDGLNPRQCACAVSHFRIWQNMLKQSIPCLLVLEDDVCFIKKWQEKWQEFPTDIFNNLQWDAILLNCSENIQEKEKWVLCKEQYLTGAYFISYYGAKWLVENYENCLCASDWMLSRLQYREKTYSRFPWLVIQDGIDTTIGSNLDADHAKVVRELGSVGLSLDNYDV